MRRRSSRSGWIRPTPSCSRPGSAKGTCPASGVCVPRALTARCAGPSFTSSEQAWTLVTTGCEASRTGYWSRWKFEPASYELRDTAAYDFGGYPPVYALGPGHRCAIFDVPQTQLSSRVNGMQVLAWGARSARTPSASDPPGLLGELTRPRGHPAFDRDHASYWNPLAVAWLEHALRKGSARRAAICRDLLRRERWDLVFTVFGETHSAGHFFWHLSQDHPLRRWKTHGARRPHAAGLPGGRSGDRGDLAARPDADVLLFSPEGMEPTPWICPARSSCRSCCTVSFGRARGSLMAARLTVHPPPRIPKALGWHRAAVRPQDRHPSAAPTAAPLAADGARRLVGGARPRPRTPLPGKFGALFHRRPCGTAPSGPR